MGDSMTVYTATKEDLLGNWVVDYSGEIFEITPMNWVKPNIRSQELKAIRFILSHQMDGILPEPQRSVRAVAKSMSIFRISTAILPGTGEESAPNGCQS